MAECDKDIRETAREIADKAAINSLVEDGMFHYLKADIAAAIQAERERCAEVVRNMGPATHDMQSTMVCDALDRAAAAIRTPEGDDKP